MRTRDQLGFLSTAPPKGPPHEAANLITDSNSIAWIEGIPDEEGVSQLIRVLLRGFRRVIRRTAPDFRPFSKLQEQGKPLPRPEFLEDGDPPPNDFAKKRPIYVEEVYQRMEE